MRYCRIAFVLALIVAAGCGRMRAQKINETLNSYIGRSVSDLALRLGPPTTDFASGNGRHAFQWETASQGPGAVVPLGSALIAVPPQKRQCRVSVVASTSKSNPTLGDWIIEHYEWNGNGCA